MAVPAAARGRPSEYRLPRDEASKRLGPGGRWLKPRLAGPRATKPACAGWISAQPQSGVAGLRGPQAPTRGTKTLAGPGDRL